MILRSTLGILRGVSLGSHVGLAWYSIPRYLLKYLSRKVFRSR